MKPGDRVTDGDRTKGEILQVLQPELGPYASASVKEEVYVLWLPELPDDRA